MWPSLKYRWLCLLRNQKFQCRVCYRYSTSKLASTASFHIFLKTFFASLAAISQGVGATDSRVTETANKRNVRHWNFPSPNVSLESVLLLSSLCNHKFQNDPFSRVFTIKMHAIHTYFVLSVQHIVFGVIFGKLGVGYELWSSSSYNFLRSLYVQFCV